MLRKRSLVFTALFFTTASSLLFAQNEATLCDALEKVMLPDVTSITATLVPAGQFATGTGPGNASGEVRSFCRVQMNVAPTVRIEVWLPTAANWNGKYLAVGGGGLAGAISYGAMLPALQGNYVTSSTDTGHKSPEVEWLSDPIKMRDYGYRAIHEMALKSKALISAYYNRSSDYSYFNGCSTGGRQGLMEAQRYPDDFNGIVSGAPVNYFAATHFTQIWITHAAKPVDATILTPDALALVTKGVMAQCDALDGVTDGLLEDPRACRFEPSSLQCPNDDAGSCLSTDQVTALEAIYQGPVDASGKKLHYGYVPGGESPEGYPASWLLVNGSGIFDIPKEYFSRAVFNDPNWDWRSFNFGSDITLAMNRTGNILEATNPNIDAFQNNGGKLLMYHGWNDPLIVPEGTIAYYENIIADTALSSPADAALQTADYARLFMVPGMGHCRGGPGTDTFDMQTALEAWVEQGRAPDTISAAHMQDGKKTMARPLCAYPQKAKYDGSGDTNDISNFSCSE